MTLQLELGRISEMPGGGFVVLFGPSKLTLQMLNHRVTLDNFGDFRAPNFEAPESDRDPCGMLWDEASFEATRTWDVPVPSEKPKRLSVFEMPEM